MSVRRYRGSCVIMLATSLLAAFAGGAAAEEFDPFELPREQVRGRIHRVAIRPSYVGMRSDPAKPAAAKLEAMAMVRLQRAGLETVGSEEFDRLWHEASLRLGGIFDPVTGVGDPDKHRAAKEHVARELQRTRDVDGFFSIWAVRDYVRPYGARKGRLAFRYYAAGEPLRWNGDWISGTESHLLMPQYVEGDWLNVSITDIDGVKMYGVRQPLHWTRIYKERSYQDRPESELFADERVGEVLDSLLEPLVEALSGRVEPAR